MNQPDLFPTELTAAQRQLATTAPAEPLAFPELPDEFFNDDKLEELEPQGYWLTWEAQYARDVCVAHEGPI